MATSLAYLFMIAICRKLESRWSYSEEIKKNIFFFFKLQLCLVYFISGISKLISPLWRSGAATYYIFNNERYSKFPFLVSYFNGSDILIKTLSYSAIVFLLLFPFIVWTRKKMPFLLISLLFHGGVAIFMGLREFLIFPLLDFLLFSDDKYIVFLSSLKLGKKGELHKKILQKL